ncbi:hypothetical protein AVEN_220923-1 [Araneus ventricosus]|uniref:Uncharacterized protein n=1 Tax=Araneus ventricosus TaxID=182803 RepID=A0A4Y2MJS3_ARAVE|nr:hypothetical protein AVEN_220923-1 [Araneus ventricosus]
MVVEVPECDIFTGNLTLGAVNRRLIVKECPRPGLSRNKRQAGKLTSPPLSEATLHLPSKIQHQTSGQIYDPDGFDVHQMCIVTSAPGLQNLGRLTKERHYILWTNLPAPWRTRERRRDVGLGRETDAG